MSTNNIPKSQPTSNGNGTFASLVEAALPSEIAVLGSLTVSHERFPDVPLSAFHFGLTSHQVIWSVMASLAKQGRKWDSVILVEVLKDQGRLEEVGGIGEVWKLTEGLPQGLVLDEHVKRILDGYGRRELWIEGARLRRLAEDRGLEIPSNGHLSNSLWAAAQPLDEYLQDDGAAVEWLIPGAIKKQGLTQMYSPRGLGKSVLARYWAVQLARQGKRVLYCDRDNSKSVIQSHFRSLGGDRLTALRVLDRNKCPPLTEGEKWNSLPFMEYDLVVIDSLNSMTEGLGEKDTAGHGLAMKCLLDLCYRDGGPAFLVIGNTVKTGAHARNNGVVEDRADVVFEVRDGTDFRPSGPNWIEELPSQGAADWQARSSRRKGRKQVRLALAVSKFRLEGGEPDPRMYEIDFAADPCWTIRDVTADVDAAGEQAREEAAKRKAAHHSEGVRMLAREIESRKSILKGEAEEFLTSNKFTRAEAREITADPAFLRTPGGGEKKRSCVLTNISAADITPR